MVKFTPMSIFFNDPCASLLGTMLFPDDATKAKGYAARLLAGGPLQGYLRGQGIFGGEQQIEHLDAISFAPLPGEIAEREREGSEVGRIVHYLWALICSHPTEASWEQAVRIAIDDSSKRVDRGTRSKFRDNLNRFAPVLHLWGVRQMPESAFLPENTAGRDGYGVASAFFTQAMTLRQELCRWNPQSEYLSRPFIGPWDGWEPDDDSRLFHASLTTEFVPARGRPGRPKTLS